MGRVPVHLRKHRFMKGNLPHNKGHKLENTKIPLNPVSKFIRLSRDEFDLVTKSVDNSGSVDIPVSPLSARFLRPKARVRTEVEKCAENERKSG